jgi:tetratricopeptide (TPR) repeat protein
MDVLAWTYHNLGQLHKAEALEVLVLEKQRKLLGEDHPETIWRSMGQLARIFYNLGQFLQAGELWAEGLEQRRKLLGEDHLNTIWIMRGLALTYHSLDRVQDAEELERLVAYHEV